MSIIYIDTSSVVALAFSESSARAISKKLVKASAVVSHHLLEAELMASAEREGLPLAELAQLLEGVRLIFPTRSLRDELSIVFKNGYLRGADALHVAAALWLANGKNQELIFLSLDVQQLDCAKELGFCT